MICFHIQFDTRQNKLNIVICSSHEVSLISESTDVGITDSVFVGVVLLARLTEGASVYGFGRDFPHGWDLFCAVSMCILTSPGFFIVVCCVIDIAVP